MAGKPSICFVAHNAYGAVARRDTGHVGGIERQQALMARWMASRGYSVTVITWAEGADGDEHYDGVRVVKACARDAGVPVLRFVHPRWSSLCRAMKRADADVYYYNCGDMGLGQVVLWCRRNNRSSVYSVASEPDCQRDLPVLKPWRERMLYRYGLLNVDHVVVQTRRQAALLEEGFGLDAEVLPMPCDLSAALRMAPAQLRTDRSPHVLWVGRIDQVKRFDWLVRLAEKLPECIFDVVGDANVDSEYVDACKKTAGRLANVRMHGRVHHDQMAKYYGEAQVLCSTSAYEGFPNTFLEAWSHGLPVVATFDPDGLIRRERLGRVVDDIEQAEQAIRDVLGSPPEWEAASAAARQYVLQHHEIDAAMSKFEEMFLRVHSGHELAVSSVEQPRAAVTASSRT
ncbi:MAG: glycosyltransferase family 4 protein [Planctomycetes bacterium]|nr:glycosyltransferase family 4 protein [Planctomycetota bacterium]